MWFRKRDDGGDRPPSEGNSFDQLTGGVASGTISRRKALAIVAGGLVGGGLLSALAAEADAAVGTFADPEVCRRAGREPCPRDGNREPRCCARAQECRRGRCRPIRDGGTSG